MCSASAQCVIHVMYVLEFSSLASLLKNVFRTGLNVDWISFFVSVGY